MKATAKAGRGKAIAPPVAAGREQARGQFQKGKSGNPKGRPPGLRNRTTLATLALLEGEAAAIGRKAVELALAGDPTALRLCIERLVPPARERSVRFDLPAVRSAADLPPAIGALLAAVAGGELAPGEAQRIADLLTAWGSAFEVAALEDRIAALERAKAGAL